jgi:hypothetical protein
MKKVEDTSENVPEKKRRISQKGKTPEAQQGKAPKSGKRVRIVEFLTTSFEFYRIPFVKILLHSCSFFFFLLFMLTSCMSDLSPNFTYIDMIVMLWVFGKSVEELTQYFEEMDLYLEDFWNLVCDKFFFKEVWLLNHFFRSTLSQSLCIG